jgi:hypothetical protein
MLSIMRITQRSSCSSRLLLQRAPFKSKMTLQQLSVLLKEQNLLLQ